MNLSPIALFVYNRPQHTRRTLQALQANKLAKKSDLFIFSDGPRTKYDKPLVEEVRSIINSTTGFKSISIDVSEGNKGLASSIISGVSKLLNKYGKIIVLEDDLVTHQNTLDYFNHLLEFYKDYPGIFSISAYSHPNNVLCIPDDYEYDVYALPRMQCWGWATWLDRWQKVDFSLPDFHLFNSSITSTNLYKYWIGSDSLKTLRACMQGEKDVWACRWVYTHFKYNAVCICPITSLVDNIGLDSSGSNCGSHDQLRHQLITDDINKWSLPKFIAVDPRIHRSYMESMDSNWHLLPYHKNIVNNRYYHTNTFIEYRNRIKSIIKYSLRHPMQALKRLQHRLSKYLSNKVIKARRSEEIHDKYSSAPSVSLIRIGTEYGGWWIPESGINHNDLIISVGAGEDISFDLELVERSGAEVIILDPTPRAKMHFEQTKAAIMDGMPASINNSKTDFYHVSGTVFDKITYLPFGLWCDNSVMKFYEPRNSNHVSHSIGNLHTTDGGFYAQCITLSGLLDLLRKKSITMLKLDIEGAEYEVIDNLISSSLRPKYILVEFHPGQSEIEKKSRVKTLSYIDRLYNEGYRVVKRSGWDYVLELQ